MSDEPHPFLAAADRIGRRLCRDALWWNGRCTWLGWSMEPRGNQWVTAFRALKSTLYDGTCGIGLLLARLSHLTGDPIARATAEAAFAQSLGAIESLAAAGEYGFYTGLSGIAWSCREAGVLLRNPELIARGHQVLRLASRIAPTPWRVDVISGSAGLIPILLSAAVRDHDQEFLDSAVQHGEHLLGLAARGEWGWSWDTLGIPNQPHLLGYAHGTSGIAWAMAALSKVTRRQEFLTAAEEALRYERSHFHPEENNWPDLRSFVQAAASGAQPCALAWCHGAPGIGIARLGLRGLLPEQEGILTDLEAAIQATLSGLTSSSGLGNFSLCHGEGGNADMLLTAADFLGRPALRQRCESLMLSALERFEAPGLPWPCGIPNVGETPNLFLGLAGIGYLPLRLHDSVAIPTLLLCPANLADLLRGT
jgi:lantibiotic biosynthesis protein